MAFRLRRPRRLLLGLATAAVAVCAFGGTASAATITASWTGAPAGNIAGNADQAYTLTLTPSADATGSNDVTIYYSNDGATLSGAIAGTLAADCADGGGELDCTIPMADLTLAGGAKTITFTAHTPSYFVSGFAMQADFQSGTQTDTFSPNTGNFSTTGVDVTTGGPSSWDIDYGIAPRFVAQGSTATLTAHATNVGSGDSAFTQFGVSWNDPQATATVTANGVACTGGAGYANCDLGTVAHGATVAIVITVSGVTYTTSNDVSVYLSQKGDGHNDNNAYTDRNVPVTDGTWADLTENVVNEPEHIAIGGTATASSMLVNHGPSAYPASVFRLSPNWNWDSPLSAASVTGGSCAVDPADLSTVPDWLCNVPAIAPGTSATFSFTWAAPADNTYPSAGVYARRDSWSDPAIHPYVSGSQSIYLGAYGDPLAGDLAVTASAPSVTGFGTETPFAITVKNAGMRDATDVYVGFQLPDGATLGTTTGASCLASFGGWVECFVGNSLTIGSSASFTVGVIAGSTGPIALDVSLEDWNFSQGGDQLSWRNDRVTVSSLVIPSKPVIKFVAAIKQTIAAALKSGITTSFVADRDGNVTVSFTVDAKTAKSLHLKSKKPVVVASGKAGMKAGSLVNVTAKFTKKAKGKLAKSKKALKLTKTVTITPKVGTKLVVTSKVTLKH